MVSIYKITNSEKETQIEINEILLIDIISIIEKRNPTIAKKLVNVWETLEDKKFNDKQIMWKMGNTTKIKHSLNMDLPLLKQELERQRLNNLPRGLIKTKFKPITNKNKLEERLIKVISLRRIALEDNNSKMLKYYNDKIEHLKLYMSIKCKKYKNSIVGLK